MKRMLLIVGAAGVVVAAGLGPWLRSGPGPAPFPPPALVAVARGTIHYRPFGTFERDGKARTPKAAPVPVAGFRIMKYQVSREQYGACVRAGACDRVPVSGEGLPQTQVSWQDATAFAAWYSDVTGEVWRLPTDREWQLAAAERYGDGVADPGDLDPGERMLAQYRAGVMLRGTASPTLRPAGGFGLNAQGLADVSGNVWEWTDGCVQTGTLNPDGTVAHSQPYCWVRIAGGLHRAAVVDFIRDASVGGCAVGLPPDHLGFRLVRAERPGLFGWLSP